MPLPRSVSAAVAGIAIKLPVSNGIPNRRPISQPTSRGRSCSTYAAARRAMLASNSADTERPPLRWNSNRKSARSGGPNLRIEISKHLVDRGHEGGLGEPTASNSHRLEGKVNSGSTARWRPQCAGRPGPATRTKRTEGPVRTAASFVVARRFPGRCRLERRRAGSRCCCRERRLSVNHQRRPKRH